MGSAACARLGDPARPSASVEPGTPWRRLQSGSKGDTGKRQSVSPEFPGAAQCRVRAALPNGVPVLCPVMSASPPGWPRPHQATSIARERPGREKRSLGLAPEEQKGRALPAGQILRPSGAEVCQAQLLRGPGVSVSGHCCTLLALHTRVTMLVGSQVE